MDKCVKQCSTCLWFDGENDDEYEFCEEKEGYVSGKHLCGRWTKRVTERN